MCDVIRFAIDAEETILNESDGTIQTHNVRICSFKRVYLVLFTLVSHFGYQFINPIISTKQNVDVYRCIAIYRDLTRTVFVSMTFSLRYRCMFYVCHFSRWYFWNFRIVLYSIVQMHAWDCLFLQPMLRDNSLFTQLPIGSTLIHKR